jgi:hypothetical protein
VRNWRLSFGLALTSVALIACILPFKDYFIELQPDGTTSLGTISASELRLVSAVLGAIPVLIVASIAAVSTRFRAWTIAWKAIGVAFLVSVILVAWAFRIFRN